MKSKELVLKTSSKEETHKIAQRWAEEYFEGKIIGLKGELGAGKTEFVRGAVKGLGADPQEVRSPSFTLMNVYEGRLPIFHFDLFRLHSWADLESIGFFEFTGQGTVFIEWPDRVPEVMGFLEILIEFKDLGPQRELRLVLDPQGPSK